MALISGGLALLGNWMASRRDDQRWEFERLSERERWQRESTRDDLRAWALERRETYLGFLSRFRALMEAMERFRFNAARARTLRESISTPLVGVEDLEKQVRAVLEYLPDVELFCSDLATKAALEAAGPVRATYLDLGRLRFSGRPVGK